MFRWACWSDSLVALYQLQSIFLKGSCSLIFAGSKMFSRRLCLLSFMTISTQGQHRRLTAVYTLCPRRDETAPLEAGRVNTSQRQEHRVARVRWAESDLRRPLPSASAARPPRPLTPPRLRKEALPSDKREVRVFYSICKGQFKNKMLVTLLDIGLFIWHFLCSPIFITKIRKVKIHYNICTV